MDVRRLQTHHAVKAGVVNIGRHAETSTIGERGLPKDILRQSNEAALAHIAPAICIFASCRKRSRISRVASLAHYVANNSEHDAHHLTHLEFLLDP